MGFEFEDLGPFAGGALGGKCHGHVHQPGAGRAQLAKFFSLIGGMRQSSTRGARQFLEFDAALYAPQTHTRASPSAAMRMIASSALPAAESVMMRTGWDG